MKHFPFFLIALATVTATVALMVPAAGQATGDSAPPSSPKSLTGYGGLPCHEKAKAAYLVFTHYAP